MLFFPTSSLIFALFIIILFIEHSGYITILISHYIYIYIYIYIDTHTYIAQPNLTCTKVKTPQPCDDLAQQTVPGNPPHRNCEPGHHLATFPLMLKHETALYFLLPHKWRIIVCLEWPFSKNWIIQELVHRLISHRLTGSCMTQVPTRNHWGTYSSMGIIKTPEYTKTSLYSDHGQSQIKFSIEDDKDTEELQLSYDHLFENTLQH